MTQLPYDICLRLRDAGLPQPLPKPGQVWYNSLWPLQVGGQSQNSPDNEKTYYCLAGSKLREYTATEINEMVFCPDAQYLLDHLPFGCVLYRKQEGYSMKNNFSQMDSDIYEGESLAHAAASAYLHLYEKTSAP